MSVERSPWIVSRNYDMTWFFGGALISALFLVLYFYAGVSIVLLWWTWLLLFDGPHIAAAFTRTYLDSEEWRKRRRVLWTSLLIFAVGPVCLVLNLVTGSDQPFLLFLGLATLYGYYHVVRQHYGFLALYKAHNRDFDRTDFHIDKWFLYLGCWMPYVYLLLAHPSARRLLGLPSETVGLVDGSARLAALAIWSAAVAVFLGRLLSRFASRIRQPHVLYILLTVLLYASVYFFVARYEPVYVQSQGPDQDFLLISILVVAFHNVQYVGLVWFHNRNRYASTSEDFGAARIVNRNFAYYAAACVVFSGIVYFASAASAGVFPVFQPFADMRVGPFTATQLGLCVWWGLGINHYYLDQKIWRVKGDAILRRNLGL